MTQSTWIVSEEYKYMLPRKGKETHGKEQREKAMYMKSIEIVTQLWLEGRQTKYNNLNNNNWIM